jgi:hypothetical protein
MPGPEDARAAHLTAKVESVENGQAQIRLAGTLEAIHRMKGVDSGFSYRGTATVAGLAAYDLDRRAMSSLLLVYQGTYQQGPEPEKAGSVQLGAVIEWQAVNNHVR